MLSNTQKAGLALIFSCMATLIAVYLDSLEFDNIGFDNPWILSTNMLWVLVVMWILWDLFHGKNIQQSLMMAGAVMLVSLLWDSYQFGFGLAQLFYALELVLFACAYWFAKKSDTAKTNKTVGN
ncbi:hypothetical protein [Undibacterium sp. Ji22W]|uniref:hypothetical protein n=1 Tax=Undibacterium sp. Ji22W TaxID=3413038 RepID=UPI003BEF4DB4